MNIELRYCSAWGYEPKAVSLTDKLLNRFKTKIKNYNLVPSMGGCFEVTVDGDLIYSKLKTGQFPDEQTVIDQVAKRLWTVRRNMLWGRTKRLTDFASCAGWAGKLPPQGLAQVLGNLPKTRHPNLLVGTETHDDAGVYRLTPELAIVQTLDFFPPVVDDPFVYGQIAASNALSDVYAMGGVPATALNLACYPDDQLDFEVLGRIIAGGAERCEAAGCAVVGGHTVRDTEIKFGLSVTGTIHPDRILTNAMARAGDVLVLTKPLGTGFITTAAKKQKCPPDLLKTACDSMVELNKSACDAMLAVGAHAATDITGFGLAGHAMEMAQGSNVTLMIDLSKLPLFAGIDRIDVTRFRTRASKTNREYTEGSTRFEGTPDPTRLEFFYDAQTSGGLLISASAAKAEDLVKRLREANTPAAVVIGEVRAFEGKHLVVT